MKLSPTAQKFVFHWGEMGTRWGVNRTVAQIHALLFCASRPLHAEDIADTLDVARSNVSTSLKELQAWGLVRVVHAIGDRRDHFAAHNDFWDIFRVVMDERKKREIDPTLAVLRQCAQDAEGDQELEAATAAKLKSALAFMETIDLAYDDLKRLPQSKLRRLLKMGGQLARFIEADATEAKA